MKRVFCFGNAFSFQPPRVDVVVFVIGTFERRGGKGFDAFREVVSGGHDRPSVFRRACNEGASFLGVVGCAIRLL